VFKAYNQKVGEDYFIL